MSADKCKGEKVNGHVGCYRQQFSVAYEYPVHFSHDLFNPENPLLRSVIEVEEEQRCHRALVYLDDGVVDATPGIMKKIESYFSAHPGLVDFVREPEIVPGGERTKNGWNMVQKIMAAIGGNHLCRKSFIIAVGGGSVLDMVGFAASLVHRGIRLIRVPTTVLAQNDAGVGVKNGMDEHGMKNFVGTFAPPWAVLVDFDFLTTLGHSYWIGGVAEAFKVAIIKDAEFFEYLCSHTKELRARNAAVIEEVVKRCAMLHLEHIRTSGDPFEFGSARPLDFGHWSAHKLELLSDYRIGHGQAVAIGIALDSYYAWRKGLIREDELVRIVTALREAGLPVWDKLLGLAEDDGNLTILKGLCEFREHLGGQLTITLPDGIGKKIEVHDMDTDLIDDGIKHLCRLSSDGTGG